MKSTSNFSVLLAILPGIPDPPAKLGDDLTLVAPVILKHIDDTNGPLNAPKKDPTRLPFRKP